MKPTIGYALNRESIKAIQVCYLQQHNIHLFGPMSKIYLEMPDGGHEIWDLTAPQFLGFSYEHVFTFKHGQKLC